MHEIDFVPEWGYVFVRSEFADTPRSELINNNIHRKALLVDMYDSVEEAYERSYLVELMRKHHPHVVVDRINTATGLSYQNGFDAAFKVLQALHQRNEETEPQQQLIYDFECMLLAQSVPVLIRHI